jgi:lysophospholipase L1-like esterase
VRLLRCLTVLAAALPLALLPAASGQAAPPSPAVYLALGDSVAFGTGATDPATQGYVPLVAADLQGDGCGGKGKGKAVGCRVELVNLAENGATTVTLIAKQLQPALDLIEARNATRTSVDDVRLITITIGGNDVVDPVVQACLLGRGNCPATIAAQVAQVSTNYGLILSALREAAGPDTTIAVTAYYNAIENTGCAINAATPLGRAVLEGNPREPGGAVVPGLPLVAAGFNDAIRQQAAAYGAVIVETAAVVDPQTETQPDCLHPNTKGHADIAAAVADAVGNPFHGRGGKKR